MAKPKKPLVEMQIDCPHCKSELKVKVHRRRLNPAEKPEYEIKSNVEVVKQGYLFKHIHKNKNKVSVKSKTA